MDYDRTNISDKLDEYLLMKHNRNKYNDVLRNTRRVRAKKKKDKILTDKVRATKAKMESEG